MSKCRSFADIPLQIEHIIPRSHGGSDRVSNLTLACEEGPRTLKGFRTGDLVKANVRTGKKIGCYVGRVAVRSSGSFNVVTAAGTIQGISHRYCRVLQKADGYGINHAGARSQNSSPSKLTKMFAMEGVSF
jgi:HNH endonuclease